MDGVLPVPGALGRTEDVAFTPDGGWLLAAGYAYNAIWAFKVLSMDGRMQLGPARQLTSQHFAGPHGVTGVARTQSGSLIAVANRARTLSFHLLTDEGDLIDLGVDEASGHLPEPARSPSVLCVGPRRGDVVDLYSCSNDVPLLRCTTLRFEGDGLQITADRVVDLPLVAVPDGLVVSPDGKWLALSNHRYHRVNLYALDQPMVDGRPPDGIVAGMAYPHGVKFLPDRPVLLVADAGAPYVHLIDGAQGWHGEHRVTQTTRVMDEATFRDGHYNPQEGGPKGLALTVDGAAFVITAQAQPIAAFEIPAACGLDQRWAATDPDVAEWDARRERLEFEEWFATGVTNAWLENEIRMLRELVQAWNNTRLVRWTRPARSLYGRLLRRRPTPGND